MMTMSIWGISDAMEIVSGLSSEPGVLPR